MAYTLPIEAFHGKLQVVLAKCQSLALTVNHGLNGIEPVEEPPTGSHFFEYHVGTLSTLSDSHIADTRAWAMGCALSDALAATELFLDDLARVAILIQQMPPEGIKVTPDDLKDIESLLERSAGEAMREFRNLKSITRKLAAIKKTYGLHAAWTDKIESMIVLRNCLVHRFGFVEPCDCRQGVPDALVLKYSAIGLEARTQEGRVFVLDKPTTVESESDSELHLAIADSEKRYGIGTRVVLDYTVFQQLLWTMDQYAGQLTRQCASHIRDARHKDSSESEQ